MRNATIFTLFTIGVLAMNYIATSLPLNGMTTGELSDRYNSLITPAGPAFSIWGIIYLSIIAWLAKIWVGVVRKDPDVDQDTDHLVIWFPLNCTFNAAWLIAWHYEDVNLSLLIMLGILWSLIMIYRKAESFSSLWKFPFSIYLGWISVATIVNVSVVAIYNQWVMFPGEAVNITLAMMVVASILALIFIHKKTDIFYGIVIAWALFFIAVKQHALDSIYFTGNGLAGLILLNIIYLKISRLISFKSGD